MPTNPYFNFYYSTKEQSLMDNLIIESLKTYGIDIYYIPRNIIEMNEVLGEEILSKFENIYEMEIWIKNFEQMRGRQEMLSKFGLEIRDEMILMVSQSRFKEITGMVRPYEGDLIYFPFLATYFEVKFVEHESMFYELGQLKVFELLIEQYEFNQDNFATGNTFIDTQEGKFSYTVDLQLINGNTNFIVLETVYQGSNLSSSNTTAEVFGWNANDGILSIGNITNEFVPGSNVIGSNSGAVWMYSDNSSWSNDSIVMPNLYNDNFEVLDNGNTIIISSNNNIYGIGL